MLLDKTKEFQKFIKESFQGDIYKRELRLSAEELEMVKKMYPRAVLQKLDSTNYQDGKSWYVVNLLPVRKNFYKKI